MRILIDLIVGVLLLVGMVALYVGHFGDGILILLIAIFVARL